MSSYSSRSTRRVTIATLLGPVIALSACAGRTAQPGMMDRTASGDVALAGGAPVMPMSATEMFTDPAIAATASVSNQSEIAPSQLALQKATHAQVRAYAQRMIDEHTRFETQMQAMLQQKGMVPAHNAFSYQMQQNLQPMMQELQAASGHEFDVLYVDHLIASHMNTLHALDTSLIPFARDPEMKAMLQQQARPAVAQHYQEVLQLQARLGQASGTGGR